MEDSRGRRRRAGTKPRILVRPVGFRTKPHASPLIDASLYLPGKQSIVRLHPSIQP